MHYMFILCVSPQLFGLTLSCLWSGLVALKMQRKPHQACCSPPCLVSPTLFDKYQSDKYERNAAGKSAITAYSTPLSIVTNLSKGRMEKEPDPVALTPILFFPIPIETFDWAAVCQLLSYQRNVSRFKWQTGFYKFSGSHSCLWLELAFSNCAFCNTTTCGKQLTNEQTHKKQIMPCWCNDAEKVGICHQRQHAVIIGLTAGECHMMPVITHGERKWDSKTRTIKAYSICML